MSEIVSRTGDQRLTALRTGTSVEKNSPPIEALGAIDELNGWIGVLISLSTSQAVKDAFTLIQHDLVDLGSQIGVPGTPLLSEAHLTRIEEIFQQINVDFGVLAELILPGGAPSASFGHVARTVCRRAERQLVTLVDADSTAESLNGSAPISTYRNFGICYLNRLSDLLFVASRVENRAHARDDLFWERGKSLRSPEAP